MDLVLHDIPASVAEREAIDAVLGPPGSSWEGATDVADADHHAAHGGHAAREQRHLLLPVLHAVQARAGWISPGALNLICQRLTIPPADAHGVASFYGLFSLTPQPPVVAHVCTDVACLARGARGLCDRLTAELGPAGGHGAAHGASTNGAGAHDGAPSTNGSVPTEPIWLESPCLGLCERAPAAFVAIAGEDPVEHALAPAEATDVLGLLRGADAPPTPAPSVPQAGEPGLRLLRRVGVVDPTSLDSYRAHGGYRALRAALQSGPEAVLREVSDSRLLGRGGAAFPTGRKWEAVARNPRRPHLLVCNADESEPGTFKDRVLLENDPFAIVEAMTIAGLATGSERGYLYLRGEYPLAWDRLVEAIVQARARGLLGEDILGRGFRFDIELRKGAGAYICGEETALFNSIEGFRGEPRSKPPFPVDRGLFGAPTVVNNVETLLNVIDIVQEGGVGYRSLGSEGSTGTRLFCLSGRIARPGLYEAPMGITLRELLELAGGPLEGHELRAVLLGGAAGRFAVPEEFDVQLSFEATRAIGTTMGSGVVMAVDETVDLRQMLLRIAAFFRDESCGQCTPCRVGTVRQEEALARLVHGRPRGGIDAEYGLLEELRLAMRDASICGLGQTAADAIESALTKLDPFREELPA